MKALTSTQGTAMAETGLCDLHAGETDSRRHVIGSLVAINGSTDWDGQGFSDVGDNPEIECFVCGVDADVEAMLRQVGDR